MLLFEITYTFTPLDRVAERIVLLIRSCLKIGKLFSSGIWTPLIVAHDLNLSVVAAIGCLYNNRSEERRVGKECRSWEAGGQCKVKGKMTVSKIWRNVG